MRLWKILIPVFLFSFVACPLSVSAEHSVQLIHYGWDNPTISILPQVAPKLAVSPFDGLTVSATKHHEVFSIKPFPDSDFDDDFATLKTLSSGVLRSSYLVVNSATDSEFDWINDSHWQSAMANMRTFVRLAKQGGFKGIVFDMEPYGKSPWDYSSQPDASKLGFDAYADLVKARGTAMMNMMEAQFRGIEVWCLYGLTANANTLAEINAGTPVSEALALDGYGLWPAFFTGWIDARDSYTTIIDGNEPSYYYTKRSEFDASDGLVRNRLQAIIDPGSRKKYRETIKLGQAVYIDGVMASAKSPRFIGYYIKTDEQRRALLSANIINAIQTSQSLVWVYSELPKWWESAPDKELDDAIRTAKADALAGRSVAEDDAAIAAAAEALSHAISIGGKILDAKGNPVKPDRFDPPLANVACSTWGDKGEYGCTFPRGADILIEPVVEGRKLNPPQIKRKADGKHDWSADFVVE
jgi:hypothetical protein